MDILEYEKSEQFERNRAIYVLCNVDRMPLDYLAFNFNLDIEEIKNILAVHEKYEAMMR